MAFQKDGEGRSPEDCDPHKAEPSHDSVPEDWEAALRWVKPAQRERIESPEFYELLQKHITHRFLAERS